MYYGIVVDVNPKVFGGLWLPALLALQRACVRISLGKRETFTTTQVGLEIAIEVCRGVLPETPAAHPTPG